MLHRPGFAIAAFCLTLCACGQSPQDKQLEIKDAWIRLPAVPGRPGAAYFILESHGETAVLQHVTSPKIERIELHQSEMKDGVMRMTPLAQVELRKDGKVEFTPGGAHAMLFGIAPAVKPGDRVNLTFSFPPKEPITVEAEVHSAGDAGHGGH